MPVDFLQEVQVKSSGYNAEYRAATGGVVSAITKSGSNALHGTAGTYYTDNKFLGDLRPGIRLNPTNNLIAEYTTTPRDKAHTIDPIFDIGGPVLKDRAWFYVGYNPQSSYQKRVATFTTTVPDGGSQTREFLNPTYDRFLRYNAHRPDFEEHARPLLGRQRAPEGRHRPARSRAERHQHRDAAHLHRAERDLLEPGLQSEHAEALRVRQRPGDRHARLDGERRRPSST